MIGLQIAAIGRRSIRRILRQPQIVVPNLFFPLFFLVINNAALGRATRLPGFGTDSYLKFVLPGTVMQAVMLSSTSAGAEVALDIESGFFDRLLSSPVSRIAILLGNLAGVAVYGAILALLLAVSIGLVGGTMGGGLLAYLVLIVASGLFAVTFGAVSMAMAIRTGSVEAVQGAFPIFFVIVFVSSAFFPTALMRRGYRSVAQANPVTWLIDALRDLTLQPFSGRAACIAVGVGAACAAGGVALAYAALSKRLGSS